MNKALQHLVTSHFSASAPSSTSPSKEIIDIIVESSNGDIRSAIMALQFACVSDISESKSKGRGKTKKASSKLESRALMEAVTRREQSLALFHLVGKLLYNKRRYLNQMQFISLETDVQFLGKGDAPAPSAAKKDIERDKALDTRLKDPPKLPRHLSAHDRKASRVDVEALYADSPIASSLLSLYLHQNYTQYCNELDECDGIMDWLSWVDFSGGEHVSYLHSYPPLSRSLNGCSGTLRTLIGFISSAWGLCIPCLAQLLDAVKNHTSPSFLIS